MKKHINEEVKESKEQDLKKLKFWNTYFNILIGSFGIFLLLIFIVNESFITTIFLFISIILGLGFSTGMFYHSAKNKKYGWMFLIIVFGIIAPITFYFAYLQHKFKGERT